MSRSIPEVQRFSGSSSPADSNPEKRKNRNRSRMARVIEYWLVRSFMTACATALCYRFEPLGLQGLAAAGAGLVLALAILLVELRLRRAEIRGLLGGTAGTILGVLAAMLLSQVISRTSLPEQTKSFLEYALLLACGYLGLVLGSERGIELQRGSIKRISAEATGSAEQWKLLDTSVLIDGRIADVCEAHFLDGVLGVPQFVLHELQMVADSADSMRRQRGRRGLEVLQRMQKIPQVEVKILDQDLPESGDVDRKLVELARRLGAKIVTNDFNLNKVATVQGLAVLNVNQLANALKPVVLPGEPMRVLILREGKEANQGVAFLDDGTMVVVEGGRRLINKSVDVLVTSVHQTTAGKMIFGRLDRAEQPGDGMRQAAAAGRSDGNGHGRGDRAVRGEYGSRVADVAPPERPGRLAYQKLPPI